MNERIPVPRNASDPIQLLIENGQTVPQLAVEWGFRSVDSIYRLKRYDYTPPPDTAQKMAATFGWTAGEVIDHWLARVGQKAVGE